MLEETNVNRPLSSLDKVAQHVGRDWRHAAYYDDAETGMDKHWSGIIWPFIGPHKKHIDFSVTMDLAAGHGRNSAKLLPLVEELHIVDINQENIDFCRERFRSNPAVRYHLTNGYSLDFFETGELTFAYCFDAMVHFDSDVVREYLKELRRVLRPGTGRAFLHHSNLVDNPKGSHKASPGWRNFMSKELFEHYAAKEGLQVLKQKVVDWKFDGSNIDCLTLLERPPN